MVTTGSFKGKKKGSWKSKPQMAMKKSRIMRLPAYSSSSRGPERKGIDLALTTGNILSKTAGSTFVVAGIPIEGSGPDDRTGRSIKLKSLEIRGAIRASAGTTTEQLVRILVIYDRQTQGSIAVSDVLQDSTGATSVYTGMNLNNKERFIVLRDRQILLPLVTASVADSTSEINGTAQGQTRNYHEFIQLKDLEQTFKASGGAYTDYATGALAMIAISNVNDNLWVFDFASRLRYTDN